ncbi:MAG: nuclear transport factor 2 family protein [Algicola sp.]|nr:nuclear transport factor 2 family protein [Algicola sp.]
MRKLISSIIAIVSIVSTVVTMQASAAESKQSFNPQQFAKDYFAAWTATQSPTATKKALEHYLSFLADNVGHQHYPYDSDDTRADDAKKKMRKGMTYYLGAHTKYSAKLLDVTHDFNVVVIKYESAIKAVHPQNGQVIERTSTTLEVLEIEDGKVSLIRKYSE